VRAWRWLRGWWLWHTRYQPLLRRAKPKTLDEGLKLLYGPVFTPTKRKGSKWRKHQMLLPRRR